MPEKMIVLWFIVLLAQQASMAHTITEKSFQATGAAYQKKLLRVIWGIADENDVQGPYNGD